MPNPTDDIGLITAVDEQVKKVRTSSLDVSFNELLDMHKTAELRIDPEYQRLFRWSEGKQSRFIESIILEMPIPPIFVIEKEDGRYELIDGLQRISSYLHFRGELEAVHLQIKRDDFLTLSLPKNRIARPRGPATTKQYGADRRCHQAERRQNVCLREPLLPQSFCSFSSIAAD